MSMAQFYDLFRAMMEMPMDDLQFLMGYVQGWKNRTEAAGTTDEEPRR